MKHLSLLLIAIIIIPLSIPLAIAKGDRHAPYPEVNRRPVQSEMPDTIKPYNNFTSKIDLSAGRITS